MVDSRQTVLLHVFSTFSVGGPQVRLAQLAAELPDRFSHLIVSLDGKTEAVQLLPASADFFVLPFENIGGGPFSRFRKYRDIIRDNAPDLLITYNWGASEWCLASLLSRIPHIHIEDGFGPEEANIRLRRRNWYRRWVLRPAVTFLVCPSETLVTIARREWKFTPGKLRFIPNGVPIESDVQKNDSMAPTQDVPPMIDTTEFRLGTVTALREEKRLDRLLRVVASIKPDIDVSLIIVGDGPSRERLEKYADEYRIKERVEFVGFCQKPNEFLKQFDIFVLTSDTEQAPLSLLEAMAAGLPIVATDVGDIKEMVSEPNRPFVVERTKHALSAAIMRLHGNPSLRNTIGRANQAKAHSHFSLEKMAQRYIELFDLTQR